MIIFNSSIFFFSVEIADELNSVFETTSDSDYSECDDSYSQNSSQSDNSELEVASLSSYKRVVDYPVPNLT